VESPEVGRDRDLASDVIDGEANAFTGFETEDAEVSVDHFHPRHARLIDVG
jgi:hypothetical protein